MGAVGAGVSHWVFFSFADVSTAEKKYFVLPENCKLRKAYTCLEGALTSVDAVVTIKNNAGATAGTITVAYSGSAAGDIDSVVPTANNIFTEGQVCSVETNGGSTGAQSLGVTLEFVRGTQ